MIDFSKPEESMTHLAGYYVPVLKYFLSIQGNDNFKRKSLVFLRDHVEEALKQAYLLPKESVHKASLVTSLYATNNLISKNLKLLKGVRSPSLSITSAAEEKDYRGALEVFKNIKENDGLKEDALRFLKNQVSDSVESCFQKGSFLHRAFLDMPARSKLSKILGEIDYERRALNEKLGYEVHEGLKDALDGVSKKTYGESLKNISVPTRKP